MRQRAAGVLFGVACALFSGVAPAAVKIVVLIGGEHREGEGKHDYPAGVRLLAGLLQSSLDDVEVVAYPDGWPTDDSALQRASTVVWYFDGLDRHPLRDPARRARFAALMKRGVGLVALHQASTVPVDDNLGLPAWLGGARHGMFDRTTEYATLQRASHEHPVTRAIDALSYRDEFYPTFRLSGAGTRTPLLFAGLHPQFRDGQWLVDDVIERTDVAWAFERAGGGRAVVFSGAHFLDAFRTTGVRQLLRDAVAWTAGIESRSAVSGLPIETRASAAPVATGRATFHVDSSRSGWRSGEAVLSPATVAGKFGQVWRSRALDAFDGHPARLYASPLYVDALTLRDGPLRGETFGAVIAASSNGFVYAINAARKGDVAAGRILWRTSLGPPCLLEPAPLDGVPTGILSTPVIDLAADRLYVTHCDPVQRWQAYALSLATGEVVPGWPVRLDEDTFNALNRNPGPERVPPQRRFDFRVQRGALNLSPDGSQLYVVFGESETGWIAAVDTRAAKVASAFAAVAMPHRGSGGIWGAGGPVVDADGSVYVVTGSGFDGYQDAKGDWAQSVLRLDAGLALRGTYTPFNYCQTAKMDIDLGAGGAMRVPGSGLLAVGGKQGNVYLLDSARLPGALDRRQACGTEASRDTSLLPPQAQPQFGTRGPLNVFGPYSEQDAALDLARARSVPAAFRDANGDAFLYVTGNTKAAPGSAESIPPSVAKLRVVEGAAPHLRIERVQPGLVLGNPGSPVVTSNGANDAIVWILDENARRSAQLAGDDAPQPVLYALDAGTLDVLWRSAPGELHTSGKYNEPAFGGGLAYVGTDRVQAFGPGGSAIAVARGKTASDTPKDPALAALDSAGIYALRCAMCHDHPQGNVPPRDRIAMRSREYLVDVLTNGAMRPHARGLDAKQIDDLAMYLQ